MPKSEIDDIFASKGKVSLPVASSSTAAPSAKKKKSKKRRREEPETTTEPTSPSVPAFVPETVVDTSSLPTPAPKRAKKSKVKTTAPESIAKAEDDDFADSRGSGSRRTTEEGWSIYKEDELGMTNEGGDTDLCPFDCECCF